MKIYIITHAYDGGMLFNPRASLQIACDACTDDGGPMNDYRITEYELDAFGVFQETDVYNAFGEVQV